MTTPNAPILRLEGVIKDYGDVVVTRVLHGVDMTLAAGEFAALVGRSGSGKSTLLNILGLLDRPTAGDVWIGGRARLRDRQLLDVDLEALMARVAEWRTRIAAIPRRH